MRVAIVQEHLDPARGGAERSVLEMADQLARLGLDVTLVCASAPSTPASDPLLARVNLHVVDPCGATKRACTRRFISRADAFCRTERFDVVHAITPCRSATLYQPRGGTYHATIESGLQLTASPLLRAVRRLARRLNGRQRDLFALERELLTGVSSPWVAAVSQRVARDVRAAYGTPAECIRVVFNGVNYTPLGDEDERAARARLRSAWGVSDDTRVVLFVAHNFRLKGLVELMRALAAPPNAASGSPDPPRARRVLVVAGRGRAAPFVRLAARLGIARDTRFVGSTGDVRGHYAAADVLAHPTWYDPCSRVVLEALCAGLPVVTTACNGASEAIEAGRHGFVVDSPHNVAALRDAIEGALAPAVRARCIADRASLRARLSMARHARELAALMERVATKGAANG